MTNNDRIIEILMIYSLDSYSYYRNSNQELQKLFKYFI